MTAPPAKPHLALIHGWGLGRAAWQPILKPLSAHYTLHLIDLPGYGEAPPDPGTSVGAAGVPMIKGVRDGSTVTFRRTYANPLPTDTFYYKLTENGQQRTVAEPWLTLTGQASGKQVCIWVKVHRASGADAARTHTKGCVA